MDNLEQILDGLEDKHLDYVVARSQANSDAEAYRAIGVSRSAFYNWDRADIDRLNDLAQQLKRAHAVKALRVMQNAAEKAAQTLVDQLDLKRNDSVKQKAAIEILDRTIGKATQVIKQDVTSGGEKITVKLVGLDD